jgi:Putative amidoligase enzyme
MPTTTITTYVHCTHCERRRLRANMSVFEGLCNSCYDAHYILCSDCAKLMRRPSSNSRRRLRRLHHCGGEVYHIDGMYCCSACCRARLPQARHWRPTPFDVSIATYKHIRSKRKYGVEVETARCDSSTELRGETFFGCKNDPTIGGAEFDSPILYGDEGLDCIRGFLAEGVRRVWNVDFNCGCHTHYDMRDETDKQLFHIAYAYALTHKMWSCCVPAYRRYSRYCNTPQYRASDIQQAYSTFSSFGSFAYGQERYDYVNLTAYCDHKTFEVRLLEGTIESVEICNWITLHCRFIDSVKDLSFQELRSQFGGRRNRKFRALVNLIGDAPLTDWLASRARYKGLRPLRGPGCAR